MRVLVLGGTRFIGRSIVESLVGSGHEVLVCHRGEVEPDPASGFPEVAHLHVDRAELARAGEQLRAFGADAVVDTFAMTGAGVAGVLAALPGDPRLVVLSSVDVHPHLAALNGQPAPEGVELLVPIDETSPVRAERYPYRGKLPGMDDYEKLDVEELYLQRGGTVLRLPFVTGPHDQQRREEPVLRRVRAGRPSMPVGAGSFLGSRVAASDVGAAAVAALAAPRDAVAGEVFLLGEDRTATVRQWFEAIVEASGAALELVRVPDEHLPDDLGLSGSLPLHLLVSNDKAKRVLGWAPTDHRSSVRASVAWHLANAPQGASDDFTADDAALAHAAPVSS